METIKTPLEKLKEIASPAPSDWKAKAEYRRDSREWLRISWMITVDLISSQEKPREYIKEKLSCQDEYVSTIMKGKADLKLSEIIKLVGFDGLFDTLKKIDNRRKEKTEKKCYLQNHQ